MGFPAIIDVLLNRKHAGITFASFFALTLSGVMKKSESNVHAATVLSTSNTLLEDVPFALQYMRVSAVYERLRCGVDQYYMFGDFSTCLTTYEDQIKDDFVLLYHLIIEAKGASATVIQHIQRHVGFHPGSYSAQPVVWYEAEHQEVLRGSASYKR